MDSLDGWHRGVGNGMLTPNVGMVILAVFSCLKPKPSVLPIISLGLEAAQTQGLPSTLKFHKGWKRWILPVGSIDHKFLEKDTALDVHFWSLKQMDEINRMTCKSMKDELQTSMMKIPTKKADLALALLRHRYRASSLVLASSCECCKGHKVGSGKV